MKTLKHFGIPLFCLAVGLFVGYILRDISHYQLFKTENILKSTPLPSTSDLTDEQKFDAEMNKYIVNIPASYFDVDSLDTFPPNGTNILRGFYIDELPRPIAQDNEIKVINEVFNRKLVCGDSFICDINYGSSYDVDNDGKKEQLVWVFKGVNHGVNDLYILKNGRTIFKKLYAPTQFTPSSSHNGFYLTVGTDFLSQVGQSVRTRYVYDQGKFVPVWEQNFTELQTTKLR